MGTVFRRWRRLVGTGVLAGLLVATALVPLVGGVGVAARQAVVDFHDLPADLRIPPLPQRSRILAADGSLIATYYDEDRVAVSLPQVAPVMQRAIVAIEDARFYEHGGLDPKGTLRALATNVREGAVLQGGSTLTQQYVKNVLLQSARTPAERWAAQQPTLARKLRELRYAIALEQRYSKDQILERYLNITYFGDGAWGVESAARHYFRKRASRLSLAEAATLAAIVRNPAAYAPTLHPRAALERRNIVLARMADLGLVGRAEADQAARTALGLRVTDSPNGCDGVAAGFFCDYVVREILTNPLFGATPQERRRLLTQGGLTIRTTLDPRVQRAAQHAVDHYVPPRNRRGFAAAQALVEPGTGRIKGMVVDRAFGGDGRGSTSVNFAVDYDHGGSIGMQAGSTFKAFTLATALDQGLPYGTRIMAPGTADYMGFTDCRGRNVSDPYHVAGNDGDGEGGRVFTLVTGTWHSVNTFFVPLERKVGLCATARMAARLGMRRATGEPLQQRPAFTLGFNTVSPLRMAAAFAAFAARGTYCDPIAISEITDSAGHRLPVPSAGCRRVLDPGVADAVTHVLQGVLTQGTAAAVGPPDRPAAGKTGTTDGYRAAWFVGYTPDLAGAVWVGHPLGGASHPLVDLSLADRYYGVVYGATIPAPIWRETFVSALRGTPVSTFREPPRRFFRLGDGEFSGPNPGERCRSDGGSRACRGAASNRKEKTGGGADRAPELRGTGHRHRP